MRSALTCVVSVAILVTACAGPRRATPDWPQAGGPDGTWTLPGGRAPTAFSVDRGEGIAWRTPLPSAGQSGICVSGDRLYLSCLAPWDPGSGDEPNRPFSTDVIGLCVEATSGAILWQVDVPGEVESPNLYAYSDSSSPTPCTDGERVFFVNASGGIACCSPDGDVLWRRSWRPWSISDGYPFNKQFEPFVAGHCLVNLEPRDADDPRAAKGWNFLRGLDARTGETQWIADDATTTYNTPVLGRTATGELAIVHGRGGWHGVPEEPVGLSMTRAEGEDAGSTMWRYVASTGQDGGDPGDPGTLHAPTWQALYVQHWNSDRAYWFVHNPIESHLTIDAKTGDEIARRSLVAPVDWWDFDQDAGAYNARRGVDLRTVSDDAPRMGFDPAKHTLVVHPAWHCNVVSHGYHWFLCSTAHGRNAAPNPTRPEKRGVAGPAHCVGRVHLTTGRVEYLELPVEVRHAPGDRSAWTYGIAQRTSTRDARGIDAAAEDRSRTDGWQIPAFWASPVAFGDAVYFTTTTGLVYVLDATATNLDPSALLSVSDLGPEGETWAMGNLATDGHGSLFARTATELIRIHEPIGDR
ncbi:MAG: PQQ-binding-like beta-propeller repeat protein [Planctomycetota bacterium]|nr:PQQ-binding-like beta-propeller repeat protein [Planctomycetota bacterium]MDA0934665.1 PQQ-binding-like beta-propeller repeat protein [Planctomycetota bacterium]